MSADFRPSRLSYQCEDQNLDHHGYCDGIADDGERCGCPSCQHPKPTESSGES